MALKGAEFVNLGETANINLWHIDCSTWGP